MSRRGLVLFVAMSLVWGVPYLLIRVAVEELAPTTLVLLRTGLAALLLLPLAASRDQLRPLAARWRPLLLYTLVEIAVPWLLLSHAEERLSSSLSGLLIAAVPLIGALLVLLVGGDERPDARRMAGLLVGLAGVAALVGLDVGHGDLAAVGEIGVVAVCYAAGPLILSRSLSDLPATGVVAASLGICALAFLPAGIAQAPAALPAVRVLGAVLALALVCTAAAFLLFFALIAEVGPVRATTITYVNPAVAVLAGAIFLDEKVTAGMGLGLALILGGSYVATRSSARANDAAPGAVLAAAGRRPRRKDAG